MKTLLFKKFQRKKNQLSYETKKKEPIFSGLRYTRTLYTHLYRKTETKIEMILETICKVHEKIKIKVSKETPLLLEDEKEPKIQRYFRTKVLS